jgi:hypothetical protein
MPRRRKASRRRQAGIVPGIEFVPRVVVPDELVRIAGGVDEIAVHLQPGEDDVHLGSLLGDQEHGDRCHGPVTEGAPGEGGRRGNAGHQREDEKIFPDRQHERSLLSDGAFYKTGRPVHHPMLVWIVNRGGRMHHGAP